MLYHFVACLVVYIKFCRHLLIWFVFNQFVFKGLITLNHFHCYFDIGLVPLIPFIKDIAVVINILNYMYVCLISKSRLFSYLYTLVINNSG